MVLLASTTVPVEVPEPVAIVAALFSKYFFTANCVGYKLLLASIPPNVVSLDLLLVNSFALSEVK